ncbi:TPA: hypothetical protein DCR49_07745 [Candidatus Delongbacteria bacterium]|nr:MAG: hypothetical protein A2Y39_04720 [Candidatus Delongbacteria bacterium GWF2_40_14]HAQ61873.1 hypothetical protein [Candidatus Delongbacteria bacterium]
MKDQEKKQKPEAESVEEEFNDLMDREFIEMLELIEKMKKGEITAQEMKKLEFIRKSREYLYGGDA